MKITIDTEDGSKPADLTAHAATTTEMEATRDVIMDGGSAPSASAVAVQMSQGSDGGGPLQTLLDTIAAAEAASGSTAMPNATADGGAGPNAA